MGAAGVARTTASAVMVSGVRVSPTTSSKPRPSWVRRSSRTVASVRTANSSVSDEGLRQPAHAAREAGEDGFVGRREGGGVVEQGAAALGEGDQLRGGGAGREQASLAGVHAAEEGLDEAVDDLVAEPAGDQVADRDVAVELERGQRRLLADPGEPVVGEDAGALEVVEVERDAHQRARERPQVAAGPDAGPRGRGVDDLEVELAGQVDPLGPSVEHRLGADVDGHPRDLGQPQLAAERG